VEDANPKVGIRKIYRPSDVVKYKRAGNTISINVVKIHLKTGYFTQKLNFLIGHFLAIVMNISKMTGFEKIVAKIIDFY
jgi:hypothetical protein